MYPLRSPSAVYTSAEETPVAGHPACRGGPLTALRTRLVPCCLGLVVLAAALLKGLSVMTEPAIGRGLIASRWFLAGTAELELCLGLWLLGGLAAERARLAALVSFTAFLVVSLARAGSGESSCGCFGPVPVSPWHTAAFDAAALVALWFWRPSHGSAARRPASAARRAGVQFVLFLLGSLGLLGALRLAPVALAEQSDVPNDGAAVFLQPEKWVGRRFPLLAQVERGDDLGTGRRTLLLYRDDCRDCRELLAQLRAQARGGASNALRDGSTLCLIEVPAGRLLPAVSDPGQALPHPPRRLRCGRVWFVKTPVAIRLHDGQTAAVSYDSQEILRWALAPNDPT